MRSIQELLDERMRLGGLIWDLENSYLNHPNRYSTQCKWESYIRRTDSLIKRKKNISRLIRKAQEMPTKMEDFINE